VPENYRDQLGHGLAQYLAEHDVLDWDADYEYNPDAEWLAGHWPTYVQTDAPQTPHRLVHIAVGSATPVRLDTMTMVQVRVRGGQDEPDTVAGDQMQRILDVLSPNGFPLVSATLGGVRIGMIAQGPVAPLGRDTQRRTSIVTNYRIRSRRPRPGSIITPPTGTLYGSGAYGEGTYA
jgi:hypothetical protein